MSRRKESPPASPGAYDSLIDAERDALIQAGRAPDRADLIRALVDAAGLPAREARRAVDRYVARRNGVIPAEPAHGPPRAGWIDDLLDAERARAARDDQSVTPRTLLRAVRQASPALSPSEARRAVADYLHRRGGHALRPGRWRVYFLTLLGTAALIAAVLAWLDRTPRPGP